MLGTGARYAEYGITGGFFLFTQALFLGLAYPDVLLSATRSFGHLLSASVDETPEAARPAIQSLLVALTLLSVFVIGLVFEIIGSVFTVFYEAHVFRKRLVMTQWFAKFVEAELPDYAEDYRILLELENPWTGNFTWAQFRGYGKRKNWIPRPSSFEVQQRFRRLESVLLAKVLTSGAKTEMLVEQISISRMSRAIGTALVVVGFEWPFAEILTGHVFSDQISLWIIAAAPTVCGILITLGAYSRFVNVLLSLVYAGWKPPTAPVAESRREQGES
jgi:hypothetical protein